MRLSCCVPNEFLTQFCDLLVVAFHRRMMTGQSDFGAEFSSLHLMRLLSVAASVDGIGFGAAGLLVVCGGVVECVLLMVGMMPMRLN